MEKPAEYTFAYLIAAITIPILLVLSFFVFFVPFGLVFVVLGAFSVVFVLMLMATTSSINDLSKSMSAANWPSVVGKIKDVSWYEYEHKEKSKGTDYRAKVKYKYSLNEQTYINDVIACGYTSSNSPELHQTIFTKLQVAKKIVVRYDPANPAKSTLAYGIHSLHLSLITSILFITALFVFIVMFLFHTLFEAGAIKDGSFLKMLLDSTKEYLTRSVNIIFTGLFGLSFVIPFCWNYFKLDNLLVATIEVIDIDDEQNI